MTGSPRRKNSIRFVGVELWAWALGRRRRVVVAGKSMAPTLVPGSFVLLKPSCESIPDGSVVVARHPSEPNVLILKRSRADGDAYWLTSDNEDEGSDSRDFGAVPPTAVLGPVTMILDEPRRRLSRL